MITQIRPAEAHHRRWVEFGPDVVGAGPSLAAGKIGWIRAKCWQDIDQDLGTASATPDNIWTTPADFGQNCLKLAKLGPMRVESGRIRPNRCGPESDKSETSPPEQS